MAEYINMQQTEYDEVQTSLSKLHQDIISGEATIRDKVIALTEIEGGFYVENISLNIRLLLENLKSTALTQMETAFADTEEAIAAFVDAVIQVDVVDS